MFENLKAVLNDFGELLVKEYRDKLDKSGSNASHKLSNTATYIVAYNNASFEVKLSLEEYWKYVEYGRKPGYFPPFDDIKKWIEIKPIIPRPFRNGYLPTINQLTCLIQDKIYKEGIQPKNLLNKSIEEVWYVMQEYIEDAIIKDCENEVMMELYKYPNIK